MNINHNKSFDCNELILTQSFSINLNKIRKLTLKKLIIILKIFVNQSLFSLHCPMYLTSVQNTLSWMRKNPFFSWFLLIIWNRFLNTISYTIHHCLFNINHPIFHLFHVWIHFFDKIDFFFLHWKHSFYFLFWIKFQFGNILKHFSQMILNFLDFFSLRQYTKKIIVGEEEKSSKSQSLNFQITFQFFLDLIKGLISFNELLIIAFIQTNFQHILL